MVIGIFGLLAGWDVGLVVWDKIDKGVVLITSSDPKHKLIQFCFLLWPYFEVPRLGLTDCFYLVMKKEKIG